MHMSLQLLDFALCSGKLLLSQQSAAVIKLRQSLPCQACFHLLIERRMLEAQPLHLARFHSRL
jgi:hypothetical protein